MDLFSPGPSGKDFIAAQIKGTLMRAEVSGQIVARKILAA
jgi:hypothetical protein